MRVSPHGPAARPALLLAAAGAALATLLAGTAGPASASPADEPVGGAELAGADVAAHPTEGVPAPPQVPAAGWLVADLDTGQVLAAKDPHGRFAPASTLKILTALVVIPQLPPDRQLVATREQVHIEGSKVGAVPGHSYTVDMLLKGMLLVSGNDAARVLAGGLGGEPAVVGQMNAAAADLHADDTRAATVTGLDAPEQTSSAYDLALISRAALQLPAFAGYVATRTAPFSGDGVPTFQITNHNPLLGRYPGTYGVKNGYTEAARASYVGTARRDGHNLLVSMIKADPAFRRPAQALLDWGFTADGKVAPVGSLVPAGKPAPAASPPPGPGPARAASAAPAGGSRPQIAAPRSLTWAAAGAGAGVLALAAGHRRRRRRRGHRRLKLPRP